MKRSGFTMIELIFVIVILGILAAVAIPKLAATRDDAKIAKGASEVATVVSDIGAYYTAQGVNGQWGDMTNVGLKLSGGTSDASSTNSTTAAFYVDSTGAECISFTMTATDGNLTVVDGGGTTSVCTGIQSAAADLKLVHQFGGSSVKW